MGNSILLLSFISLLKVGYGLIQSKEEYEKDAQNLNTNPRFKENKEHFLMVTSIVVVILLGFYYWQLVVYTKSFLIIGAILMKIATIDIPQLIYIDRDSKDTVRLWAKTAFYIVVIGYIMFFSVY